MKLYAHKVVFGNYGGEIGNVVARSKRVLICRCIIAMYIVEKFLAVNSGYERMIGFYLKLIPSHMGNFFL